MNWFTIVGTIFHVLKNAPDIVDDVEDFWNKITGKVTPPAEIAAAVADAITIAKG